MQRLRPRRLALTDRIVLAAYGALATATAGWLMQDLSIELVIAAAVRAVPIAAGVSAYGRPVRIRCLGLRASSVSIPSAGTG